MLCPVVHVGAAPVVDAAVVDVAGPRGGVGGASLLQATMVAETSREIERRRVPLTFSMVSSEAKRVHRHASPGFVVACCLLHAKK